MIRRFRVIKPEIRVLGVDDGVFIPHVKGKASVIGVVFRGGYWLDGVMHTQIDVDGFDATKNIANMIVNSPHYKQLRVVMLNGVTFGGFNVVDIKQLSHETSLPVIAVVRDKPDFEDIHKALGHLPLAERRWQAVRNAGREFEVSTRSKSGKVYFHVAGIHEDDAKRIVRLTSTRSSIPEALRVAHIIASGVSSGSS